MEIKLPYGLKDDNLVSIDEVESGLACECLCPGCKKQLIAKKGNIKIHHFAHYKTVDCKGGIETALHVLSKELIASSKTFITPILYYPNTNFEIFPEIEIPIDKVTLEKRLGEIIPDVIIESKGKKLLIEVVVNNPISRDKMRKIVSENIPTIVIYAKYLLEYAYNKKDFGLNNNSFLTELISGTKYKRWFHNPKIFRIEAELKNNYAEEKIVKSFNTKEMGQYNFVDDCPLEKKFWKSGINTGKPYASIDYDCNDCKFCISIDYKQIPHKRLEFYSYSVPSKVYCLGYLKREFRDLLKQMH